MQKTLTMLLLLSGITASVYSQMQSFPGKVIDDRQSKNRQTAQSWNQGKGSLPLTATACSKDTVEYGLAKATGLLIIDINTATSARSVSQYYDVPQSMTIHGVTLYAFKIDAVGGITGTVTVEIYNSGVDSMPAGSALASVSLQLDTVFGGGQLTNLEKNVTFTNPVTVTQPYVLVVDNNNTYRVGVVVNDYSATTPDGLQEWLASAKIGTTWLRGYDILLGADEFDADALLDPHMTTTLDCDFTYSPACLLSAGTVTFTDGSSPILQNRMYNQAAFFGSPETSYEYDFGDGSPGVFNEDTTHAYAAAGPWVVTHTDTLFGWRVNCGEMAQKTIPGTGPSAGFSAGITGLTVNFTDTSSGTPASWAWDFGDGGSDTNQNPTHTFGNTGTYSVCLIISNSCSADTICKNVSVTCVAPVANFTGQTAGLTATFTNSSISGVTFSWDFGDGNSSVQANPVHIYSAAGTYNVCLTAVNPCGTDTFCQQVGVTTSTPVAGFTFVVNGGIVTFTDTSLNTPTSWAWDFGDAGSSTSQNPTHNYAITGSYNVCLIATNSNGSDTACDSITAVVGREEFGMNEQVTVYPNPAGDQINLAIPSGYSGNINAEILDLTGRVQKSWNLVSGGKGIHKLEITELNPGLYILRIDIGIHIFFHRIQISG